jgi:hypothetical protein
MAVPLVPGPNSNRSSTSSAAGPTTRSRKNTPRVADT